MMVQLNIYVAYSPQNIFKDSDITDVIAWGEHIRYHDIHVTDSDYVVTYLDPTVYTAWCLYNTQSALPPDYIPKLRNYGYKVCYFTEFVPNSEPLRNVITMAHTHELFVHTEFSHRIMT